MAKKPEAPPTPTPPKTPTKLGVGGLKKTVSPQRLKDKKDK